jgi:hypothetical protein
MTHSRDDFLEDIMFLQNYVESTRHGKTDYKIVDDETGAISTCVDSALDAIPKITALLSSHDKLVAALENLERTAGLPAMGDDPVRVIARQALEDAKVWK